jgi:methionyl-tRNA formyltransferase
MSIRVVFMGSPDFAVPSLKALTSAYPIVGVVTQPDREAGRGRTLVAPPVKTAALDFGLPVIQPEKLHAPEAMEQLQAWAPDLIVVAAFGQILRPAVLDLPNYGCINVHGSLLPRWRGAAPIQAAILAGDKETGITIMKMDSGVDTGPMLSQSSIPIAPDNTADSIFKKMSTLGAELLLETLPDYLNGSLHPRQQPEVGVTYAPMLKKEDGRLDFTRSAEELARRVRAFNPWPGAFFEWRGGVMKVHAAHASDGRAMPGTHLIQQKMPAIATGDGVLVLDIVQPAGKKPMPGKAFLAGTKWGES